MVCWLVVLLWTNQTWGQLRLVNQPGVHVSGQRPVTGSFASGCVSVHSVGTEQTRLQPSAEKKQMCARLWTWLCSRARRPDCKRAGVAWNALIPLPAASTHLTSWQDFLKGAGKNAVTGKHCGGEKEVQPGAQTSGSAVLLTAAKQERGIFLTFPFFLFSYHLHKIFQKQCRLSIIESVVCKI